MDQQLMDQDFCQSCAMPLADDTPRGTNANGSANDEYCEYCYKDGAYTADVTMDQMIDLCTPFFVESVPGMTSENARAIMTETFPTLKRWQTA